MGTRLKLGTKSAGDGEQSTYAHAKPEKEQEKKVANLAERSPASPGVATTSSGRVEACWRRTGTLSPSAGNLVTSEGAAAATPARGPSAGGVV